MALSQVQVVTPWEEDAEAPKVEDQAPTTGHLEG